jgi:hypothetical protein
MVHPKKAIMQKHFCKTFYKRPLKKENFVKQGKKIAKKFGILKELKYLRGVNRDGG